MNDWHLCAKHETAYRRYQSARNTWTLTRKDPEPEEKRRRPLIKLRLAVGACGKCWPKEGIA